MPVAVGIIADSYKAPVSGFSPLSIPWHSAFWASDPSWTPPADGGAVSDWRNAGTSAANAGPGFSPTYRAAYTGLNGKPAVEYDGVDDYLYTASPLIAQPNHVFVVGWLHPTHGANPTIIDGLTNRHFIRNTGTNLSIFGGSTVTVTGAGRNNAFASAVLFNGASSTCRTNGTAYTVSSTVGASGVQSLKIGSDGGSSRFTGAIAFLGVSDTELTAQQITDLETWANTYYGVPIP